MKTGTLILITSKNPPVFNTPMTIGYKRVPKKGQSFTFWRHNIFDVCHLSVVQRINRFTGGVVIQTLNSVYTLVKTKDNEEIN